MDNTMLRVYLYFDYDIIVNIEILLRKCLWYVLSTEMA